MKSSGCKTAASVPLALFAFAARIVAPSQHALAAQCRAPGTSGLCVPWDVLSRTMQITLLPAIRVRMRGRGRLACPQAHAAMQERAHEAQRRLEDARAAAAAAHILLRRRLGAGEAGARAANPASQGADPAAGAAADADDGASEGSQRARARVGRAGGNADGAERGGHDGAEGARDAGLPAHASAPERCAEGAAERAAAAGHEAGGAESAQPVGETEGLAVRADRAEAAAARLAAKLALRDRELAEARAELAGAARAAGEEAASAADDARFIAVWQARLPPAPAPLLLSLSARSWESLWELSGCSLTCRPHAQLATSRQTVCKCLVVLVVCFLLHTSQQSARRSHSCVTC